MESEKILFEYLGHKAWCKTKHPSLKEEEILCLFVTMKKIERLDSLEMAILSAGR